MTRVTAPGPVPPELGQEKEEPEQAMEEDIPTEDRGEPREDATRTARARDGEQVRREG